MLQELKSPFPHEETGVALFIMSVQVSVLAGNTWCEQTVFLHLFFCPPTANYITVSYKMWNILIHPQMR